MKSNTSTKKDHFQINESEHTKHNWRAHDLLPDFEIEDVWRFPVVLKPEHTLVIFQQKMKEGMSDFKIKGLSGLLFQFRLWLGRIFSWDNKNSKIEEFAGSLRERYATEEGIAQDDLPPLEGGDFELVYQKENETLSEIDNATVHAALHLGRVPIENDQFTIQMTVYVKPKGIFGRLYMQLIKLPRLLIVYPAMMRIVGKKWKQYKPVNS